MLEISKPNLQSVTSIVYIDTAGDSQTWDAADYQVDANRVFPRIAPAYGESWPSTRDQMNAVTITAVYGYGDDWNDVPESIRHAILIMTGDGYEHREDTITGTIVARIGAARALLDFYRVPIL